MLITELKDKLPPMHGNICIICCEGCREVHFPDEQAAALCRELTAVGSAAISADYICNPDNVLAQLDRHMDRVNDAEQLLVLSCGVGVQAVAGLFEGKKVLAACDSFALPGFQGLTPLEYGCEQCGECYLNSTGGICPITSCSKSLVNGQCGGSKNGKCEVDREMECGWDRIHQRLERLQLDSHKGSVKVRNHAVEINGVL